ncbi:RNase H domain-containing protein [Trichonephila clavipes]|nr:RNase H domain-containing protein [Trichonephila clavipes]
MKFSEGRKSFEMCTNCSSEPASPAHILEFLGLTTQDLADDTLLVLDFLKVYEFLPEAVARVAAIVGDSSLPHASALTQRDLGCVLGVQQTKQLPHVAIVDLVWELGV